MREKSIMGGCTRALTHLPTKGSLRRHKKTDEPTSTQSRDVANER